MRPCRGRFIVMAMVRPGTLRFLLLLWGAGGRSVGLFAASLGLVGFMLYGPDSLLSGAGAIDLGSRERGLLLYLRQEGRGIGLVNKVRAYALQDAGLDTVDANRALGFRDDERDYAIAAHMLASLNVSSVKLMTNNPDKVAQLEQHGIRVAARIPHVMRPNEHNRFYLETKAARSGHHIDFFGKEHLAEQDEPVIVEADA